MVHVLLMIWDKRLRLLMFFSRYCQRVRCPKSIGANEDDTAHWASPLWISIAFHVLLKVQSINVCLLNWNVVEILNETRRQTTYFICICRVNPLHSREIKCLFLYGAIKTVRIEWVGFYFCWLTELPIQRKVENSCSRLNRNRFKRWKLSDIKWCLEVWTKSFFCYHSKLYAK